MKISHATNIFSINDWPVGKKLLDDVTKRFLFCKKYWNSTVKVEISHELWRNQIDWVNYSSGICMTYLFSIFILQIIYLLWWQKEIVMIKST